MSQFYEALSAERKDLQSAGNLPDWFSTAGWAMFKERYLYGVMNPREHYRRIARTLARHMPDPVYWEAEFFEMMWDGDLSLSTPALGNTGTDRGLVVACAGNYIGDSVDEFFKARHETAMLSKYGHGTSSYLGDIRPRGAKISTGGRANGLLTEFIAHKAIADEISQGGKRRGQWAGYVPMDHPDFWEVFHWVDQNPDGSNVGWNIYDRNRDALLGGDPEHAKRFSAINYLRCKLSKGYLFFPDKVNRASPEAYKRAGLEVKASNLCNEVSLASNEDYTFSCVLSALNLMNWDRIVAKDRIFKAHVLLDCLVSEYLELGADLPGMAKIMRYTREFRSLGLGVLGYHSALQTRQMAFGSLQAHMWNIQVFKKIHDETLRASQWLAQTLGEPLGMQGLGERNSHRTACMPTMSTAAIMGGFSEGVGPMPMNVFSQSLAGGEFFRINPVLLPIMQERGVYDDLTIKRMSANLGSVQGESWLDEEEKSVFRTFFETNPYDILRQQAARQKYICQGQSINVPFSQDENPQIIADFHRDAILEEGCHGQYYLRTAATPADNVKGCEACQ